MDKGLIVQTWKGSLGGVQRGAEGGPQNSRVLEPILSSSLDRVFAAPSNNGFELAPLAVASQT